MALEVLIHGPLSRSEVARRLDLSPRLPHPPQRARCSNPACWSMSANRPTARSAGRRKLLDVVPASRHFIGMKLMADEVLGVTTDLRANVLATESRRLPAQDPDSVVAAIAELVRALRRGTPDIVALGIGVGGLVEEHGLVRSAPFLHWTDVLLGPMVEAATGIPTIVENDLVAFTEYEHWFGAGRGLDRFAVVTLGAGIGYGLVIHDEIVRNDEFGIGLIGHWPLDPFGPVCSEGHRGCAKAVLTDTAIAGAVSQALGMRCPIRPRSISRHRAKPPPAVSSTTPARASAGCSPPSPTSPCRRPSCSAAKACASPKSRRPLSRPACAPTVIRARNRSPSPSVPVRTSNGAAAPRVVAIQTFVLGHRSDEN